MREKFLWRGGGVSYSNGVLFFSDLYYNLQYPPLNNFGVYCENIYNQLYLHKVRTDTSPAILNEVNKPILSRSIDEGFTFIRHANGKWWWLVGQVAQIDSFYTFLIKDDTVLGPKYHYSYVSTKTQNPSDDGFEVRGQMKANQQGDKIIRLVQAGKVLIYEFDRCTGEILSGLDITNVPFSTPITATNGGYGASFSNSGNSIIINTDVEVTQYDITNFPSNITRRVIYKDTTSGFFHHNMSLSQLGPDGKIYISKGGNILFPEQFPNPFFHYLAVVQNPDELVAPVQVDVNGLYLGDSSRVRGGLPNMPNYLLGPLPTPCVVNAVEPLKEAKFKVYPNPASTTITLKSSAVKLDGQLNFYNLSGQVVYQSSLVNESTHEWNVNGLPNGIYYLRLTNGTTEPYVQKVVVIR